MDPQMKLYLEKKIERIIYKYNNQREIADRFLEGRGTRSYEEHRGNGCRSVGPLGRQVKISDRCIGSTSYPGRATPTDSSAVYNIVEEYSTMGEEWGCSAEEAYTEQREDSLGKV